MEKLTVKFVKSQKFQKNEIDRKCNLFKFPKQ